MKKKSQGQVPPIQKSFYWIMIWLIENLFISLQSEPKRYDYELLTNGTTGIAERTQQHQVRGRVERVQKPSGALFCTEGTEIYRLTVGRGCYKRADH